jgi:hypothetical protein
VHRGEISESVTAAELEARIAEWLDQPREVSLAASVVAGTRVSGAAESMIAKSLTRTRVDLRRESMRAAESTAELPNVGRVPDSVAEVER